jgi:thioredoxin-related protein
MGRSALRSSLLQRGGAAVGNPEPIRRYDILVPRLQDHASKVRIWRPDAMRSTAMLCLAAALVAAPALPLRAGDPPSTAPKAKAAPELEWLEYGEALDRAEKEKKHVIVDFYTNWCGWCKKMDRDTYGDSAVAAYIHDHFVLSKVNAESQKPIKLDEGTTTGVQLARQFKISGYPATWFIRPDGNPIDGVAGYQAAPAFHRILVFVHEKKYEKETKQNP